MNDDRIQPGIYFRPGDTPQRAWGLVLLDVAAGTRPSELATALASATEMLTAFADGHVRELEGMSAAEFASSEAALQGLDILVAFGRRLFDQGQHDPPLTVLKRPPFLSYLPTSQPFPSLPWLDESELNRGESDILLQLSAPEPATVNRAVIEIWKLITDDALPLEMRAFFDGFGRPDGRGWLEFHDGVSNLRSSERLVAIEALGDPEWMKGGTYLAFLRLHVALASWRALSRSDQEGLIGRDKISGRPFDAPEPHAERRGTGRDDPTFRDPPETLDPELTQSHIHRANQNRVSPHASAGLRIFRQGFDFLDSVGPDGPVLGLNFVSYQSDLSTIQHLLRLPSWLGDVNFAGAPLVPEEPAGNRARQSPMITVSAGGFYAVPPTDGPFPGAGLFGT